jgi:predicted aspartyl protease
MSARHPSPLVSAVVGLVILLTLCGSDSDPVSVRLTSTDGWLVAPVVFGAQGDTLRFIVDTGASRSAVSARTAGRYGLRPRGRVEAVGASGPASLELVALPTLGLGTIEVRNLRALVLDDAILTPFGGRLDGYDALDGVLGVDILRRFDVLLDAPSGRMVLFDPGEGPGPLEESLSAAVAISSRSTPLLRHQVEINGVRVTGVLDSGSRRVVLNSTAARLARIEADAGSGERTAPGVGAQETIQHAVTIDRLRAGGLTLESVDGHMADLPVFAALGIGSTPAVLLGAPVLDRCPVFVSYSTNTLRYCRRPTG